MNLIGYVRGKVMEWTRNMKSFSQQLVSGQWTCNNSGRHALPAVCWCLAKSLVYTHSECVLPFGTIYACMHACVYVCMYVCVVWGCGCCVCVCVCMYVNIFIIWTSYIFFITIRFHSLCVRIDIHLRKALPFLAFFSRHCWQHPQICQTWLLQIVGWIFSCL